MRLKKLVVLIMAFFMMTGFDFKEKSGLTAEQLEKGLLHELKPLAETFVEIENEYGINSVVYSSMVALESGWGRSKLSESNNNITSHREGYGFKEYNSKAECLLDTAKHLNEEYLDEDGLYYDGGTDLESVSHYYCIGKAGEELNWQEQKAIDYYVGLIEDIAEDILYRAEGN